MQQPVQLKPFSQGPSYIALKLIELRQFIATTAIKTN